MPKFLKIENKQITYKKTNRQKTKYGLLLIGVVLVGLALLSGWLARVPNPPHDLVPPLIPYSAKTIDRAHVGCISPLGVQMVESWYFRHWLGTDEIGRDVAAGLLMGLQNALLIGVSTMFISVMMGLLVGLSAGFWGNERLKLSFLEGVLRGGVLSLNFFWSIQFLKIQEKKIYDYLFFSCLLLFSWIFIQFILLFFKKWLPYLMRPNLLPLDGILMRLVEIIQTIPALLIILAVSAILPNRSFWSVILLLSLFSWVSIARLVRNATLQLKNQEFIVAAHALGLSDWQILWRHILPNVMPIVWVNAALGISNVIAAEAVLSFLGLGVPLEEVTWGGMLHTSRYIPSAWWLAVSAGLAIFGTIRYFEAVGNYFSDFRKT
jgi:peptide/nickel transport system permease protein